MIIIEIMITGRLFTFIPQPCQKTTNRYNAQKPEPPDEITIHTHTRSAKHVTPPLKAMKKEESLFFSAVDSFTC